MVHWLHVHEEHYVRMWHCITILHVCCYSTVPCMHDHLTPTTGCGKCWAISCGKFVWNGKVTCLWYMCKIIVILSSVCIPVYIFLLNVAVSSFPSGQFQTWVWGYTLNWLSNCRLVTGMWNVHAWRAWYLFSCDHDIFEIGPEVFGSVLRVIQPTLRSTLGVYDIHPPW